MNLVPARLAEGALHLPGGNQFALPEQWRGALASELGGDEVVLGFRPEATTVQPSGALAGQVYANELHGAYTVLHLALDGDDADTVIHARADRHADYEIGTSIHFDLDPQMVRFFDPQTERAIQVK